MLFRSEPDVAGQIDGGVRVLVDLSSGSEPDSEGSSFVPASKPAVSSRKTKELEAAARKAKAVTPPLVLKERRSKSAADVDAGAASPRRKGTFQKRGVLPTKKLTSRRSRPTTAGLAPSTRLAAEKEVDAIVEEARDKATAKQQEKE